MKNNLHHSRLDCEPTFRHGFMASHHGDGNERNAALHGQIEWPFFERQQLAIERALPFHVNNHVQALTYDLLRGPDRFNSRIPVTAIHGNQRSHAHRPAKNGIAKQFFLDHDGRTPRNQRNQDRRIEIGNVIRHEDVTLRGIECVESHGFDAHAGDADAIPRAPHKQAVEQTDVTGDEGPGKADGRRNRSRKAPEGEHGESADHFWFSLVWFSPVWFSPVWFGPVWFGPVWFNPEFGDSPSGCPSPLSQAARRARCAAVTVSKSPIS